MVTVTGLERMTFEVLRVLREHGAVVHCIINDWEGHRIAAMAEQVGASWSESSYRVRLDRHTRSPLRLARMLWDISKISAVLLRESWRLRPTHILMPEFMAVLRNAPALLLLRLSGTKIIHVVGNAPTPGKFYRFIWRWLVNPLVNEFICVSLFTQHELFSHDIPAEKVRCVYLAPPTRSVSTQDDPSPVPNRIIFVGQIIPGKGLHLLLDAVGLLVGRGYDVRLDVVGRIDGWVPAEYAGYREQLLWRAEQVDLKGRVHFLGWREDVPGLMKGAAVHCCPSTPEIREAFGLVTVEAKEAGIPSVVFRAGAKPELVNHRIDGWICDEVSGAALAEGIEYFIADSERTSLAGKAASLSVRKFSRETFTSNWLDIFNLVSSREASCCLTSTKAKELGSAGEV